MQGIKATSKARERLEAYSSILKETDILIRRLEVLKGESDGFGIQQVRVEELERQLPEAIQREQKEGRELAQLIDQLGSSEERQLLKMRYFDLLKWPSVCAAIYDDADAPRRERGIHMRMLYRKHSDAIEHLNALL